MFSRSLMGPLLNGSGDVLPSIRCLRSLVGGAFRGITFDRGTSSAFFDGVFVGNFIGDIFFLLFVGSEGSGLSSEYLTLSSSSSDGCTSPSDSRSESMDSVAEVRFMLWSLSDLVSWFMILFSSCLSLFLVSFMFELRWCVCCTIDCCRSLISSSTELLSLWTSGGVDLFRLGRIMSLRSLFLFRTLFLRSAGPELCRDFFLIAFSL